MGVKTPNTVRLPRKMQDLLEKQVEETGWTKSQVMADALKKYFEAEEKKAKK